MSTSSNIEWTEATWNPVVGCQKVSPGCANCYAETMARRLACMADADAEKGKPPAIRKSVYTRVVRYKDGVALPQWNGKAVCVPEALSDPLKWRKPRRVFVNSMSDLFHEDVPFEFIDQVFAVMALCPQHTFQVLTKRPKRMASYFSDRSWGDVIGHMRDEIDLVNCKTDTPKWLSRFVGKYQLDDIWGGTRENAVGRHEKYRDHKMPQQWPLANVWLGTSVENQKTADERIPHLLKCPAAVRWLSCEPLLGDVKIDVHEGDWHCPECNEPGCDNDVCFENDFSTWRCHSCGEQGLPGEDAIWRPSIRWVVAGGESGKGARPMHPEWARSLRDQCADGGVPFFFKQWGAWMPAEKVGAKRILKYPADVRAPINPEWHDFDADISMARVGKKAAGRLLDGAEHNAYPEVDLCD